MTWLSALPCHTMRRMVRKAKKNPKIKASEKHVLNVKSRWNLDDTFITRSVEVSQALPEKKPQSTVTELDKWRNSNRVSVRQDQTDIHTIGRFAYKEKALGIKYDSRCYWLLQEKAQCCNSVQGRLHHILTIDVLVISKPVFCRKTALLKNFCCNKVL